MEGAVCLPHPKPHWDVGLVHGAFLCGLWRVAFPRGAGGLKALWGSRASAPGRRREKRESHEGGFYGLG